MMCLEQKENVFMLIHEFLLTTTRNYTVFCHNFYSQL